MASRKNWTIAAIIIVVLIVLGVAGNAYMSSPAFCGSCHEMKPYVAMWEKSPHKDVNCLKCHSEPGLAGFVKEKITGLKETYKHFAGFEQPIEGFAYESRCLECHKNVREINKGDKVKIPHAVHLDNGMKCASCHSRVAHGIDGVEATFNADHQVCSSCHDTESQDGCITCHEW